MSFQKPKTNKKNDTSAQEYNGKEQPMERSRVEGDNSPSPSDWRPVYNFPKDVPFNELCVLHFCRNNSTEGSSDALLVVKEMKTGRMMNWHGPLDQLHRCPFQVRDNMLVVTFDRQIETIEYYNLLYTAKGPKPKLIDVRWEFERRFYSQPERHAGPILAPFVEKPCFSIAKCLNYFGLDGDSYEIRQAQLNRKNPEEHQKYGENLVEATATLFEKILPTIDFRVAFEDPFPIDIEQLLALRKQPPDEDES